MYFIFWVSVVSVSLSSGVCACISAPTDLSVDAVVEGGAGCDTMSVSVSVVDVGLSVSVSVVDVGLGGARVEVMMDGDFCVGSAFSSIIVVLGVSGSISSKANGSGGVMFWSWVGGGVVSCGGATNTEVSTVSFSVFPGGWVSSSGSVLVGCVLSGSFDDSELFVSVCVLPVCDGAACVLSVIVEVVVGVVLVWGWMGCCSPACRSSFWIDMSSVCDGISG